MSEREREGEGREGGKEGEGGEEEREGGRKLSWESPEKPPLVLLPWVCQ